MSNQNRNIESHSMKTEKDGSFSQSDVDKDSRRAFLEKASAALVVIGAPPAQGNPPEDATGDTKESLFQPEHLWTDRMRAPDDGKRYGWFVDTRRCVGCHAFFVDHIAWTEPMFSLASTLAETDFYSTVLESGKEFVASEKSVFSLDAID